MVEVDKETGFVELKGYSVVHDAGKVINPMIVDGQVQGGIAQELVQLYMKKSFTMRKANF